MFFPESQVRIGLYTRPVDMRKSFDGLAAQVKYHLQEAPLSALSSPPENGNNDSLTTRYDLTWKLSVKNGLE